MLFKTTYKRIMWNLSIKTKIMEPLYKNKNYLVIPPYHRCIPYKFKPSNSVMFGMWAVPGRRNGGAFGFDDLPPPLFENSNGHEVGAAREGLASKERVLEPATMGEAEEVS